MNTTPTIDPPDPAVERPVGPESPPKRRRRLAALGAMVLVGSMAAGAVALRSSDDDKEQRPPEVTFSGALQAIEEGKVSRVHMTAATREAFLVLSNGDEVVAVYPEQSAPELVDSARQSDVILTASRPSDRKVPWPIVYLPLLVSLGCAVLFVWIFFAMDRRGIWHEKDTWIPGPRAKRLQASVDRLEAAVDRIERRPRGVSADVDPAAGVGGGDDGAR